MQAHGLVAMGNVEDPVAGDKRAAPAPPSCHAGNASCKHTRLPCAVDATAGPIAEGTTNSAKDGQAGYKAAGAKPAAGCQPASRKRWWAHAVQFVGRVFTHGRPDKADACDAVVAEPAASASATPCSRAIELTEEDLEELDRDTTCSQKPHEAAHDSITPKLSKAARKVVGQRRRQVSSIRSVRKPRIGMHVVLQHMLVAQTAYVMGIVRTLSVVPSPGASHCVDAPGNSSTDGPINSNDDADAVVPADPFNSDDDADAVVPADSFNSNPDAGAGVPVELPHHSAPELSSEESYSGCSDSAASCSGDDHELSSCDDSNMPSVISAPVQQEQLSCVATCPGLLHVSSPDTSTSSPVDTPRDRAAGDAQPPHSPSSPFSWCSPTPSTTSSTPSTPAITSPFPSNPLSLTPSSSPRQPFDSTNLRTSPGVFLSHLSDVGGLVPVSKVTPPGVRIFVGEGNGEPVPRLENLNKGRGLARALKQELEAKQLLLKQRVDVQGCVTKNLRFEHITLQSQVVDVSPIIGPTATSPSAQLHPLIQKEAAAHLAPLMAVLWQWPKQGRKWPKQGTKGPRDRLHVDELLVLEMYEGQVRDIKALQYEIQQLTVSIDRLQREADLLTQANNVLTEHLHQL